MKSVKWVLVSPSGQFAGLKNLHIVETDIQNAQVFDGRDNADSKLSFYRLASGINWQIRLVE